MLFSLTCRDDEVADDGAEWGLPSSVALKPFQCCEGTIPSAVGGGKKEKTQSAESLKVAE